MQFLLHMAGFFELVELQELIDERLLRLPWPYLRLLMDHLNEPLLACGARTYFTEGLPTNSVRNVIAYEGKV